jgi:hypothetical protein
MIGEVRKDYVITLWTDDPEDIEAAVDSLCMALQVAWTIENATYEEDY